MSRFDFEHLRQFQERTVLLRTTEGEVMRVKVIFVSRSEGDLIYDLIESNQPERYTDSAASSSYAIPWEYIEDIRLDS